MRINQAFVIVFCSFVLSCGSPRAVAPDIPAGRGSDDVSAVSGPDANPELSTIGFFEAELLEDIELLQLAVDDVVEEELQSCMKADGFDYERRSMSELANRLGMEGIAYGNGDDDKASGLVVDQFSSAQSALASLSAEPAHPDLNEAHLASLSEEERAAWNQAYSRCLVSASERNPNPLANEGDWLAAASEEASNRTAGSTEVVEASAEFDRCFSAFGYGDVDEVYDGTYETVQAVLDKHGAGQLSIEAARMELEAIAVTEAQMSRAFEGCDEPYQAVTRRVYAAELQIIAEREADKAALWAAEVGDLVRSYLDRLGERR